VNIISINNIRNSRHQKAKKNKRQQKLIYIVKSLTLIAIKVRVLKVSAKMYQHTIQTEYSAYCRRYYLHPRSLIMPQSHILEHKILNDFILSIILHFNSCFPRRPQLVGFTMVLFLHCSETELLENKKTVFMDWMSFLLAKQQCQITEENSKH